MCYQVVMQKLSWKDANKKCKSIAGSDDASLASIKSHQDQTFISGYLKSLNNLNRNSPLWIGLSNMNANSRFEWTDGTPVGYTNWNVGEPNNSHSAEDCVELQGEFDYLWNDYECQMELLFVCQKRGF